MRRLDRALFAIFLLALLADVAWSQAPAVVTGDSAGGLIWSVAGPLRDGTGWGGNGWDDAETFRRAGRAFAQSIATRPGFRSYRLGSSQWAQSISNDSWRVPPTRSSADRSAVLLVSTLSGEMCPQRLPLSRVLGAPSVGVYEHSSCPAP
jgi:hypothetical protein